ncbi:hypothetical protein L3X38_038065 [Prunus dulcis]|uniref:Uncharacterized protein n=1 Tax=Prunus dulcis TaxID=3755 RepID=A0AAD4V659_PRUDU|nr:hypothetical protein L3X38_038065 [Prunus dulcis]
MRQLGIVLVVVSVRIEVWRQAQEKDMDDREMKIKVMDTSHMSPETKAYWKHRRRDVMRRKLFHHDGPSNTDWLNDENH